MAKAYLISISYIKDNSIVNENIDPKLLNYAILESQDISLQEIIGTDLYEQIKDQVINNNLTADNTNLLDNYITPYLLNKVVANSIIPLQYKMTQKGMVQEVSQDAQVPNFSEVGHLRKLYETKSQDYGERLRRFLLQNNALYPLYLNGNKEIWKMRPIQRVFSSGMFLGRVRKPYNNGGQSGLRDDDMNIYYNCCGNV